MGGQEIGRPEGPTRLPEPLPGDRSPETGPEYGLRNFAASVSGADRPRHFSQTEGPGIDGPAHRFFMAITAASVGAGAHEKQNLRRGFGCAVTAAINKWQPSNTGQNGTVKGACGRTRGLPWSDHRRDFWCETPRCPLDIGRTKRLSEKKPCSASHSVSKAGRFDYAKRQNGGPRSSKTPAGHD